MILFLAVRFLAPRLKRWLIMLIAALASGCAVMATKPNIMLSGQEEVPAVKTTGFGMGRVEVNKDGRVSGTIKISDVDVTAAHIHVGAVGRIGPPIVTLVQLSSKVWMIPPDTFLSQGQISSYRAGELYINVHSPTYKGGEIRGQLRPGS